MKKVKFTLIALLIALCAFSFAACDLFGGGKTDNNGGGKDGDTKGTDTKLAAPVDFAYNAETGNFTWKSGDDRTQTFKLTVGDAMGVELFAATINKSEGTANGFTKSGGALPVGTHDAELIAQAEGLTNSATVEIEIIITQAGETITLTVTGLSYSDMTKKASWDVSPNATGYELEVAWVGVWVEVPSSRIKIDGDTAYCYISSDEVIESRDASYQQAQTTTQLKFRVTAKGGKTAGTTSYVDGQATTQDIYHVPMAMPAPVVAVADVIVSSVDIWYKKAVTITLPTQADAFEIVINAVAITNPSTLPDYAESENGGKQVIKFTYSGDQTQTTGNLIGAWALSVTEGVPRCFNLDSGNQSTVTLLKPAAQATLAEVQQALENRIDFELQGIFGQAVIFEVKGLNLADGRVYVVCQDPMNDNADTFISYKIDTWSSSSYTTPNALLNKIENTVFLGPDVHTDITFGEISSDEGYIDYETYIFDGDYQYGWEWTHP